MDLIGALSLGAALLLLLLAISQGHQWGWLSPLTVGVFVGSIVMFAVWVWIEKIVDEPLVDMRMFVHRPVMMANL
ncbi:MFS transporter, partial [Rhodococcus erythropolis]|nr:MFS transporter [Rhodococcus erythropolis]